MKVYIVELLSNYSQDCQLAHLASSLDKAVQWIKLYGREFGSFEGNESSWECKFVITSEIVDDVSGIQFESFGHYTIHGEPLPYNKSNDR